MVNENLKNQFDQAAKSYDKQRQDVIPHLDQIYSIIAELAYRDLPRPKILDLGAGTGLLSEYIFKKYSKGSYTLIDISKEMLKHACQRFDGNQNFNFIHGDYLKADFDDTFDIVVSALSIHHLEDNEKKILYRKVYEVLNDGGIFLNADQVIAPNPENEYIYQRNWWKKVEDGALTDYEKQIIINRMKLDKPASLESNIKWLEGCGFINVDVFYKYYNFCIIYGKKSVKLTNDSL